MTMTDLMKNNGHRSGAHPIHAKAWGDLLTDLTPDREHTKPRRRGLTMILDRCQGLTATKDILEMTGDYLDQVKLSFGTSVLLDEPFVRRKNDLIRSYGVDVYPGGTLAELMLVQGVYPQYLVRAKELGFTMIELSDGTITLPRPARRDALRRALDAGFKVISEVGKKDPAIEMPVAELCDQIADDLSLGAEKVIVEARESGIGIGIYDANGGIRKDMVRDILSQLPGHEDDIMWEAPHTKQQAQLILLCGSNVSLGNVKPRDVLGLEALRRGLRFETFRQFSPRLAAAEAVVEAGLTQFADSEHPFDKLRARPERSAAASSTSCDEVTSSPSAQSAAARSRRVRLRKSSEEEE
jgi:phosphosulfolactate synthase